MPEFTHPPVPAVAHHGVDEALVKQVFEENRRFFSLPEQEKRRILANENNRCALLLLHAGHAVNAGITLPCVPPRLCGAPL